MRGEVHLDLINTVSIKLHAEVTVIFQVGTFPLVPVGMVNDHLVAVFAPRPREYIQAHNALQPRLVAQTFQDVELNQVAVALAI